MKKQILHIANIQTGLYAKPEEKGDVVYLQAKHFDKNGELKSALYPDIKSEMVNVKHILKAGDILFAAKGTKNFAALFEKHNIPAVASTSFFVIRITERNVLPEYLVWVLNHPNTQIILKDKARGTSIPSIRKADLDEIEFIIPAIEKQRLIVQLSKLARKESSISHKIADLKNQLLEQELLKELNKII